MKVTVIVSVVVLGLLGADCFIIPDELPSLLSVIYSNIPTIKKGTDSRLGWGFRLGDRADFQVMVELGPQTNTQQLANQGEEQSNKRNTLENLANTLYAQRQHEKKEKERLEQKKRKKVTTTTEAAEANENGAEWLQSWSQNVNQHQENEALPIKIEPRIPLKAKPGLAIGEIDAKSVIPDEPDQEEKKATKKAVSTPKPKTTTSKEDALDNVDLD